MISIFSYHLGIQGSNLNLLDFNRYLQDDGKQVTFYTKFAHDLMKVVKQSKRPYRFDELKEISDYNGEKLGTVFTDFKSLIKMFKDKIKINCDKMYVFDNNELSYHLNDSKSAKFYHDNIDLNEIMKTHKYKDVMFFMPPSNIKKFEEKYDFNHRVFFKKIHPKLLQKIPFKEKDILWYRFDDIDVQKEMKEKYGIYVETRPEYDEVNLWDYKGLIYYRRKHLNYYEQLGRLVFEFILLGKEVHFLKDPFEIRDGLADYLEFYEIKFDENFKVLTTASELAEKMNTKYKLNE